MTVDERVLDEKLTALEAARTWTPRTVSKLESLIRSAPDEHDFAHFAVLCVDNDILRRAACRYGEAIAATFRLATVLQPGHEPSDALTKELQQLVKDAKGSQQSPKSIDYIDAIPLTAVGKPDKKIVRTRYWNDGDRAVS